MLSGPELVNRDEYKLIVQGVSPELHEAGFAPSRLSLRLGPSIPLLFDKKCMVVFR